MHTIASLLIGLGAMRIAAHKLGYRPRRRPKASWAKWCEALALLIAAWSTRGMLSPAALKSKRKPYSFDGPATRPKATSGVPWLSQNDDERFEGGIPF